MTDLSNDELFRLLSSSRRRQIIYLLFQEGGPMSLNDLATRIAAEENEKAVEDVTDSERQRVYISLYQTHLPKLEDSEVVEYDEDERIVTPTSEILQESFFFGELPEPRSWFVYSGALAALGWLGLAVAWTGVVGWPVVAVGVVLGVTVLGVLQYLERDQQSAQENVAELLVD
jgi:hypothetical protein